MEIMKLTIKEDFHRGTCYVFSFSYHKITLFEKKYIIKLITLISMYHLKSLVNADVQIALHFSDPFCDCFSLKNFIDGLCILKIQ